MGSEQSNQAGQLSKDGRPVRPGQLRRGKSVPEPKRPEPDSVDSSRPGSCSPGLSVCSDSDLPYISYTVNRPIGDSPVKIPSKQGHLMRGKSLGVASLSSPNRKGPFRKIIAPRTTHNIVVVKPAAKEETAEKDPEILRLQNIPMFLPIMRGTLNLPAARDPEILERLDPGALYKLCLRCQTHLNECATNIAEEQNVIVAKIKGIDAEVSRALNKMTERQRTVTKEAEAVVKVGELAAQIAKCHLALNKTLETLERLNNSLPPAHRLEPFVWTTG